MTKVYDLAPPRNWQDFEDLCLDLFRERLSAPFAEKHGREFQPQAGVDVYGRLPDSADWFGVQCKKTLGEAVTARQLREEAEKAQGFNPQLGQFILATTARRDEAIQTVARELTERCPFEVQVYGWDSFCEDLAGRTELLRKHFPDHFADDPADLRSHYLRHLIRELDVLQFTKAGTRDSGRDIALSSVYIDLDVTATVTITLHEPDDDVNAISSSGQTSLLGADRATIDGMFERALDRVAKQMGGPDRRSRSEPFTLPCTALEAVAAAAHQVLIGRGGSGKSTFGRYLCLCLAGEILDHETLNLRLLNAPWQDEAPSLRPWPHDALVPFFVELRQFVRSQQFPDEITAGQARHLVDYLTTLGPADAEMGKLVRGALDSGALVVLDGLDETPAADEVRERLRQIIASFVEIYPHCRVLVTSRPYAYDHGQDWRLDDAGFVAETLAPLDDTKIERFVEHAYAAFATRHRLDSEDASSLSSDLLRQIRGQKSLRKLAEQPLMLTMMADLHAKRGGRLPGARSALFEASVELLFDNWNERRRLKSVSDLAGMDEEQIRGALELLAFRVHRDSGASTDEAADIPQADLIAALVDVRKRYGNRDQFELEEICDHLNERSGILIAESPSIYRFPHRYFQEYLAACHLDRFSNLRDTMLTLSPTLWREVVLFLAGRLTSGDGIWKLLRELVPAAPSDDVVVESRSFERAFLAALVIREHRLWEREESDHQAKLDDVCDWLRRAVELGALEVRDRAQAGQVLGLLGDDRLGVGLGSDGLPSIDWVEIREGSFIMGSERDLAEQPVHDERVDAFRISRYPLTNAQYEPFVEYGGYSKRWRHCWTDAGWEWKGDREGPKLEGFPFDLPNHPRVNVCWYEAVAFCRWLSEKTGVVHRLPTEAEWERAARGVDGCEYPWRGKFDASLCNVRESGFGTTTAAGLFPGGESPTGTNDVGVLDAGGNTWEWCSTQWRESYKETVIDDLDGSAVRVLRGGSFASYGIGARCASRLRSAPGDFDRNVGFRVVSHGTSDFCPSDL